MGDMADYINEREPDPETEDVPASPGADAPTEPRYVRCDYCGSAAERVGGDAIYPHRPDLHHKQFYLCRPCWAYVGCHASNGQPFGRLADARLRAAKIKAHAAFDAIWKSGEKSRGGAYAWLSEAIGLPKDQCHIGMMDLEGCSAVVDACAKRNSEARKMDFVP